MGPSLKTVGAVVAFVTAAGLLGTLTHTNDLLKDQLDQGSANLDLGRDASVDRLRAEYQRVLLGCHTAGAESSADPDLRQLCDVQLPKIKRDLQEAEG